MDRISVYWRNATAAAVGEQHGVTDRELAEVAPRLRELTRTMAAERKAGRAELRYRDLPYDEEMSDAVAREVEHFRDRCELLVVLGIGGSALGSRALHEALNPCTYNLLTGRARTGPQLFVLDNVDPDHVKAVADLVAARAKKAVVNVVSKSGRTIETMAQFALFRDVLQSKLGKKHKDHLLATTDPDAGPLRAIATAEGYHTLDVPSGVGGRFSVLSAVGLFSAAMCGIDVDAVLAGAREMDKRVKELDPAKNPAAMLAAIHYLLDAKGKTINVLMPYSTALRGLGDWYGQLWAESLGKRHAAGGNREVFAGLTPVTALGATDQHAQLQLYREGPNDKLVTFLEVERFGTKLTIPPSLPTDGDDGGDALKYLGGSSFQTLIHSEKLATEYALRESRRPTMTIVFPQVLPEAVGQFFYLYETAVSYLGGLMGVNPYDAPAVELGKQASAALMGGDGGKELARAIQAGAKREPKYLI
jgi:glucose-6-phosphate isomerase